MPAVAPVADLARTVGAPFGLQLSATGGKGPYRWSATSLPPGVALDPATGVLPGSTAQPGLSRYPAAGTPVPAGTAVNITIGVWNGSLR